MGVTITNFKNMLVLLSPESSSFNSVLHFVISSFIIRLQLTYENFFAPPSPSGIFT